MTLTTVAVNGRTIEERGLSPLDLDQWFAPPEVKYSESPLLGRWGTYPSSRGAEYSPRVLTLVAGAKMTDTLVEARAKMDDWFADLQGELEIEVVDAPGKVCYGVFERGSSSVDGIKLLSPLMKVVGQIVCRNPLWYDRSPTTVSAAAGTRVALPMGSAPGRVRLILIGSTDPVITARRHTGEIIGTMEFTVTLGATELLVIDGDALNPTVTKYTAGVASNAIATLNSDSDFLTFSPEDKVLLEVDSGSIMAIVWRGYLT